MNRACMQMCIHMCGAMHTHISMCRWAEYACRCVCTCEEGCTFTHTHTQTHIYVQVSRVCADVYTRVWRGAHSHVYVQVSGVRMQMCEEGWCIHISMFRIVECVRIWVYACVERYLCSGKQSVHAFVCMCLWRPMVVVRSLLGELSTLFTEAGSLSCTQTTSIQLL